MPRLTAVIVLWPQVALGTSSTAIDAGVFSSDLHTPMWPPLYQAFATAVWRLTGGWAPAFVTAHVAVHALVGVAMLVLASRLGLSRRTGWVAVIACAVLPYLVAASVRQIDVGISVSVAAIAAAAMTRADARAGLAAGAWFLLRPESLFTIIALALWRAVTADAVGRRRVLHAAVVFASILVVWSAANAVRFGRFTPLPANAGQNLYIGHRPGVAARLADRTFNPQRDPDVVDPIEEPDPSPYGIDAAVGRLALRHIRDDPGVALGLVPLKFARYWDWRLGADRPHSRFEELAYSVPYLALLLLAPVGAWRLWRTGERAALAFLAVVIVGYTVPHLVIFGFIRMRMTVEWALILVSASAIGELRLSPPHVVGSAARLAR